MTDAIALRSHTVFDADDCTLEEALTVARRIAHSHTWIGVLVNSNEGLTAVAEGGYTIGFFTPRCGKDLAAAHTAALIVSWFGLVSYDTALQELTRPADIGHCEGHAFMRQLIDKPLYP